MAKVSKAVKLREKSIVECRVKCECSCVTIMTPRTDWCICRWCGKKIYRTPQLKFKYEIIKNIKKVSEID